MVLESRLDVTRPDTDASARARVASDARARAVARDMTRARAPRRVHALVDARAIASGERARGDFESTHRSAHRHLMTFRAFVVRAVERASDGGRGRCGVEFGARACDGWAAPHAFEARQREGRGGERARDGAFAACDGRELDRRLRALGEACEGYAERFSSERASGGTREWLVNLARNAGAAANDFSSAGFGSALGADEDEDEDEDGGDDGRGVLFIVMRLPEMSSEEARAIDPGAVVKSFRGVEEQLKRERARAHLLYVGAAPSGVFATVLRDVFRRFNGAVLSLDAACRLASWAPLYATLDALGRGSSPSTSEATTNESTTSVDILVETKSSSKSLRLGEAHVAGPSDSRCSSLSIVGFVDRTLVPATTLATESQTVFCFDDSPLRALMAMLALKDAVAIVRRDAREYRRLSVLEPLTSSSFVVASLKLDALEDEEVVRSRSEATSVASEIDKLVSNEESLMSLESIHGLLAKIRQDMYEKLVSPTSTQPSTTQDSLALTQHTIGSFQDVATQSSHDVKNARTTPRDVRTIAEAMAADCELGVSQCASRLESWYGSRDLTSTTRQMLRMAVDADASITSEETLRTLDARFKTMMKNHLGIVSPPRKSKARRSLATSLMLLAPSDGIKPWTGDVDAAARKEYDAFVATLGKETIDPDTREFAMSLILRFRQSIDGDDAESFDRIERTLGKSAKELQDKYKDPGSSKSAKRLEFVLQMHVALQIAAFKVMSARGAFDGSDTREAVEEHVFPKKEQKAFVKRVKKLMHEIEFLLTPIGIAGIRAVVETEFLPNYEDALPDTLRSLQVALGISTEPMAEDRNADSVVMTPFSPQALPPPRRSPRKHKQPDAKVTERQAKPPPARQVSWHPTFRSHKIREVVRAVPLSMHGFAKPPAVPNRGGSGTSRNALAYTPARPTVVNATPLPSVSGTPAVRSRPGVVMETPIGLPPVGVLTPRVREVPPTPKHLFATPAAKKTRFSD